MFYSTEEEDTEQEPTEPGEQAKEKDQEETQESTDDAGQDGQESRDDDVTSSGMGLIGGYALGRGINGQPGGVDKEERQDSGDREGMGDMVKEDSGVEEREVGGLDTRRDDTYMGNCVEKVTGVENTSREDLVVDCKEGECNVMEEEKGLVTGSEAQAIGGMGDMDRGCEGVEEGGPGKWEDSEGEDGDCNFCCSLVEEILSCLPDCLV